MQNRVNLGFKKKTFFMSKTHMSLCFYVFGNAPVSSTETYFLPEPQKTDTTAQLKKSSSSPRAASEFLSPSVILSFCL
jgi:hypothetical protein